MCPRLLRAAMPRGRQVALVRLRERELAVKEREQEIKHREVETKAGCMARHATNTAVAIRPAAPSAIMPPFRRYGKSGCVLRSVGQSAATRPVAGEQCRQPRRRRSPRAWSGEAQAYPSNHQSTGVTSGGKSPTRLADRCSRLSTIRSNPAATRVKPSRSALVKAFAALTQYSAARL